MRKLGLFITTTAMIISMSMNVFAGEWKQDATGWWFQNDDGSYPGAIMTKINKYWYYFDNTGYMKTGWLQFSDGWYSFRDDGSCANPISQTTGLPVGAPAEGWVQCGANLNSTLDGIANGNMKYHNGLCWCSPEYFQNLKDLVDADVPPVRENPHTLQPGIKYDLSNDSSDEDDYEYYDDDYYDDDYE